MRGKRWFQAKFWLKESLSAPVQVPTVYGWEKINTSVESESWSLSRQIPETVIIVPRHPIFIKLSCCAKCLLHFKTLSLVFFIEKWEKRTSEIISYWRIFASTTCVWTNWIGWLWLNCMLPLIDAAAYVTIEFIWEKKNMFTHTHCVLRVVGHPSSAL